MNELIELLKRWAELDPERCGWEDSCYSYFIHGWPLIIIATEWTGSEVSNPAISKKEIALLQAAIQEAIEARGWDWKIRSRSGIWDAAIYPFGNTWEESDHSPAAALLAAYLEALTNLNDTGNS